MKVLRVRWFIILSAYRKVVYHKRDYVSYSVQQVSAHIATRYFAANFRLETLSPNQSRKEAAQKEWSLSCNLLVKDQCVQYCIARREEILAGCNRSGVFPSTRGFDSCRVACFPKSLRINRMLLHASAKRPFGASVASAGRLESQGPCCLRDRSRRR